MKETIANLEQQIARLDETIERARDFGFTIHGLKHLRAKKLRDLELMRKDVQGARR